MKEADRVAPRIAIIDHGKIVAHGTAAELQQQTGTNSLEEAFLTLTGSSIRSETATSADQMRAMAAMWRAEGSGSGCHLHVVAAAAEALRPLARPHRRLARAALLFLVELGFGFGPVFQRAGQATASSFSRRESSR